MITKRNIQQQSRRIRKSSPRHLQQKLSFPFSLFRSEKLSDSASGLPDPGHSSLFHGCPWAWQHFVTSFGPQSWLFLGSLQFSTQVVSFPRFYVAKTRRDKFGRWNWNSVGRLRTCAPRRHSVLAKDAGNRNSSLSQHTIRSRLHIVNNRKLVVRPRDSRFINSQQGKSIVPSRAFTFSLVFSAHVKVETL